MKNEISVEQTVPSESSGSTCGWFHEDADYYSTQCGKVQISISDGEGDELYKYCPHCSGLIVVSNIGVL